MTKSKTDKHLTLSYKKTISKSDLHPLKGVGNCYAPEKIPETPVFLTSGCDSPEEVAEPPVLHLPSPGPSIMPVGQVRQFSWHYSDKHGLSDVRQKLRKNNKQINSSSLFPSFAGTSRLQGPPPSSHSED